TNGVPFALFASWPEISSPVREPSTAGVVFVPAAPRTSAPVSDSSTMLAPVHSFAAYADVPPSAINNARYETTVAWLGREHSFRNMACSSPGRWTGGLYDLPHPSTSTPARLKAPQKATRTPAR